MKAKLVYQMEQRGYAARLVSIQHLDNLREGLAAPYRDGLFDPEFHQERLFGFVFSPPASLPEARSLIVVAVKQPQVRFTFTWQGKSLPAVVPPTYLHWQKTDRQVQDNLAEILGPAGYQVVPAVLSKKLLAVHSGLAAYGRNNLAYVPGLGSFHRLAAFYSDRPGEEGDWQPVRMMERCEDCRACLRHCPSGAISSERFLLHAERCIVFHNEKPGSVPFPAWLQTGWHNCLVGCMHCQTVCPENKGLGWIEEGADFSAEETALLLAGAPPDRLPDSLAVKLAEFDLLDLVEILPRNLSALFHRAS